MSTRKNVASAPIVYKILQLIDHFRGDPTPHFSDSWIAKRVGEQVEDVQLALARMRDDAWLAVQRGPDGTAAYWLTRDGGRPALAEARANPRLRLNLTIWKNEVLTGMREGTPPKGDPQGGSWQQTEITRAALPS
ncbi:MAG: hypothetical protein GY832_47275, partial [Chloroflexi bacterium]|nr:hypothetical protein [Chloroflexota bacterium]